MARRSVRRFRSLASIGLAVMLMAAMAVGTGEPFAAAAPQDVCSSGAHSLSPPGSRVYPEMGNGGYTSVHTDLYINYDAIANQFLPGTHADLGVHATQCLTDLSFDFEQTNGATAGGTGPNMTVNSVEVNGQPAAFVFKQPTYPGDPNGDNDPDPAAHAVSNVNPVSATNPNPPACSPQTSGNTQNDTQCPANKLVVTPPAPIPNGSNVTVTIDYTGRPGVHVDGDGSTEGWFRIATAGFEGSFVTTEPVGNDSWMPMNNFPTAKPTYDIYDTTNIGKVAIGPGELVGYTAPVGTTYQPVPPPAPNPPDANFPGGSVTWHWHSPERIANYLVENSIGAYVLTARTSPTSGVQYWEAQASSITAAKQATNKTAMDNQEDIVNFQQTFNGPWPMTTDGIVVGTPSASFEEEMQGKITFAGGTIGPSLGTFNHENMHQWFGDNVSEDQFAHTFWKEGWARVGEYLNNARTAATNAGGLTTPAGQQAFDTNLINQFNTNYGSASSTAWTVAPSNPTVNNLFTTQNTYTRPGTTYLALRQILDASATRPASDRWIQTMKYIQSTYGGGNITEPQLVAAFQQFLPNQSAGCATKLQTFFTQWFDTAYPAPNNSTNKPQITGPGLNAANGDHFYDNATACTKASQTITFGPLANKVIGDPDFMVSGTSDSGLTVTFGAAGPCTVNGTAVHITGAGLCTITASQAGDGVFDPATDVPQSFRIAQTTSLAVDPASGPYAGTAAVSATLTGGGSPVPNESVSFTLNGNSVGSALTDVNGVANIPNASLAGINAGSYPNGVAASFAGDDSLFTASSGTGDLTVGKADQTIDFPPIGSQDYGVPAFDVIGTATSGLTVNFTATGNCTITPPNHVHLTGAGSCSVTAHQPGDSNYNAAPDVGPNTFVISPASTTTVAHASPSPAQYSDPVTLSATVSTGGGQANGTVKYFVNGASVGTAPVVNGASTLGATQQLNPAGTPYTIKVKFTSSDTDHLNSTSAGLPVTVGAEDARVSNVSVNHFQFTASTGTGSANVTFTATVKDISQVAGDPATDPNGGNIAKAIVSFTNAETGRAFKGCGSVAVSQTSPGVGTAQCTSLVNAKSVGKLGAGAHDLRAIVKGAYYTDNEPKTDHVFTVAKPFASSYVVGDGELDATGSTGSHAGDRGTHVELGFGSRQVGLADPTHFLVVLQSGGRVYRVTGSSGAGLPDSPPNAAVTGTGTITDITDPNAPAVVDSAAHVTFTVHSGVGGGSDTVGVAILDHLSSNWFTQAPAALTTGGVRVV